LELDKELRYEMKAFCIGFSKIDKKEITDKL